MKDDKLRKRAASPETASDETMEPHQSDDLWLPLTSENNLIEPHEGSSVLFDNDQSAPETSNPSPWRQPILPGQWFGVRFSLFLERWDAVLRSLIAREYASGGAFLWGTVLFATGCLIYFVLPREPLPWAFPSLAFACLVLSVKVGPNRGGYIVLIAIALLAIGTTSAQWRTARLATIMLPKTVVAQVSGTVLRAEHRASGSVRYTLDLTAGAGTFEARGVEKAPTRIRLTARKNAPVALVGQKIRGRARLGPPSSPVYPGAYDFAFQVWFFKIGATGFFLGYPEVTSTIRAKSWTLSVERLRENMSQIIRSSLPGRPGALAAALIVGDRSGIDDDTAEALRRSGLAHILAISGLHMGLVAVTVMSGLRFGFALIPSIALYYPVRKWAAIAALFAATGYLMVSGANVSTQRAYIMVAIMLSAIALDRRALTMRNVAFAAIVVLLLAPEAILSPGFQMSFAAVAALISGYEWIGRGKRAGRETSIGIWRRILNTRLVKFTGAMAMTSLIAGIATGLFAAYHFHRVATFGLLANVLAMPLVTFAVMPMALVSVIAMPFGLEALPLSAMALAVEPVADIAGRVATMEPQGRTGYLPVSALMAGVTGLLIATLMRTRLKLFSLPAFLICGVLIYEKPTPDILVLGNGEQVGVVKENGELVLSKPRAQKFATGIWKSAFAPTFQNVISSKPPEQKGTIPAFSCDAYGCAIRHKGLTIVHAFSAARLHEDCAIADIIVFQYDIPEGCTGISASQPLVLEGATLSKNGSYAITISDTPNSQRTPEYAITTSKSATRPWAPGADLSR